MSSTVVTLASIPAILAFVQMMKEQGLPNKSAAPASVILGVLFSIFDSVAANGFNGVDWFTAVGAGIILGLSASGLYDTARLPGSKRSTEHEDGVMGERTLTAFREGLEKRSNKHGA